MAIVESTTIDGPSRPCICKNSSTPDATVAGSGETKLLIGDQPATPEAAAPACPRVAQRTFTYRRMTVSYIGPSMPYLRFQGRWLDRAGFRVGTPVRVEVAEGRLILEVVRLEEARCAEPNCPDEVSRKRMERYASRASPTTGIGRRGWPVRRWYQVVEPEAADALKEILPIERRRERLSTHALAARAEVNVRQIRALEEGERLPSVPMFIVLAWALDLDPRDLFDRVLKRMNYPEGSRPVLANRAAPDIPRESSHAV
jgi:ribosome-binding protein aMBF1 (putative translation factor)